MEPTAALAATLAVVVALGLYAGALTDALPGRTDRAVAEPTLDRVHRQVTTGGATVLPRRLPAAPDAAPDGLYLNATLRTADERWSVGPTPPARADGAGREVGVRLGAGQVDAGTLRVEVWA